MGDVTPVDLETFSEWAKTARRKPTRTCETCLNEQYRDAGILAAIEKACQLRAKGETDISLPQLAKSLVAHGYAYKDGAVRNHIRECLKFDWKRRVFLAQ